MRFTPRVAVHYWSKPEGRYMEKASASWEIALRQRNAHIDIWKFPSTRF